MSLTEILQPRKAANNGRKLQKFKIQEKCKKMQIYLSHYHLFEFQIFLIIQFSV